MKSYGKKLVLTVLLALILVISFAVTGCTQTNTTPVTTNPSDTPQQPAASAQVYKLTMDAGLPPMHFNADSAKKWVEKLQTETNGRLQITLYFGGTLIPQEEAWDELRAGVGDICGLIESTPGTPFYISKALSYFFYGTDSIGATKVYNELWKKYPQMAAEYGEVKYLYAGTGSSLWILTKSKPVKTLDDFKGMQLLPPPGRPELLAKLGATGTVMPLTEMFPALDKGIVEGTFNGIEAVKSLNFADVTKYGTNLHVVTPPVSPYCMNLKTWNSLPPDIQKIIEDSLPWMTDLVNQAQINADKEGLEYAQSKGFQINEMNAENLAKFYAILEEMAKAQADDLDARGLPGTQILQDTRSLISNLAK
jgi:TRAP-type transport system periplasmic protein